MDPIGHLPTPEIQGHLSFNKPAKTGVIAAAFGIDFALQSVLFLALLWLFEIVPIPTPGKLVGWLIFVTLLTAAQLVFLKQTAGLMIWKIEFKPKERDFIQRELLEPIQKLFFGFVTLLAVMTFALTMRASVLKNPLLQAATIKQLDATVPQSDSNWAVLPYFYVVSAWPKKFNGTPVLMSLPYQKGPPVRFAGEIIARWSMPHTQLTIEGPKTPTPRLVPGELRSCFTSAFVCPALRESVLSRHIHEMKQKKLKNFALHWLQINDSSLPPQERSQGIYLAASNSEFGQERVIWISNSGAQQTLILDRPQGAQGAQAHQIFERILASTRVASDLTPGRALANDLLSKVRLEQLRLATDSVSYVSKLAEIQMMLMSKISVDPATAETYYHLGGTAYFLSSHAAEVRTRRTNLLSPQMMLMVNEWAAVSKPTLKAALMYLKDIAPDSPDTTKLEQLWIETKNRQ